MDELSREEINVLRANKYPGMSWSVFLNVAGAGLTIILWVGWFSSRNGGSFVTLFDRWFLHLLFPPVYWITIYGLAGILNRKMNIDIRNRSKSTTRGKIVDLKLHRSFAHPVKDQTGRNTETGYSTQYIVCFDGGDEFVTWSEKDELKIGDTFLITKGRYSGVVVGIEKTDT